MGMLAWAFLSLPLTYFGPTDSPSPAASPVAAVTEITYERNCFGCPTDSILVLKRDGTATYTVTGNARQGTADRTSRGRRCVTCIGLADIRWTASLVDVTKPWRPMTVGSDLALQVTVTDKGDRHGSGDSIGITLWNGNALLFSSKWNGSATLEQLLKSGRITVD